MTATSNPADNKKDDPMPPLSMLSLNQEPRPVDDLPTPAPVTQVILDAARA
jgi:hypothetical protein